MKCTYVRENSGFNIELNHYRPAECRHKQSPKLEPCSRIWSKMVDLLLLRVEVNELHTRRNAVKADLRR